MGRHLIALILALLAASAAQAQNVSRRLHHVIPGMVQASQMHHFVPGQLLVKFTIPVATQLQRTHPQAPVLRTALSMPVRGVEDLAFMHQIGPSGWTLWQVPSGNDLDTVAAEIAQEPGVYKVEKVKVYYPLLATPNDADWNYIESVPSDYILDINDVFPTFRRLWHLDETNAFAGWSIFPNTWYTAATKPTNVPSIAFIDSGIDPNHGDFINAGGTGIDTSQGGQIDLAHSRQFKFGAPVTGGDITDQVGHGTHVIGLALASGNNGAYHGGGTIGIGYSAKGTVLRVFGNTVSASGADVLAAIYYAADNGADVISMSVGGPGFDQGLQDAVTYAFQKGSLVVSAGAEDGKGGGSGVPTYYPAGCSGSMAVTGSGPDGSIGVDYAGTGNYIDIAAPGGELVTTTDYVLLQYVYSTACSYDCLLIDESATGQFFPAYQMYYTYLIGTSMACPQVSGAAGLYYGLNNLSQSKGYSNIRAYRALEKAANGLIGAPYGGWEPTQGYGLLDVQALLMDQDARSAQVGSVKGIVYSNGSPAFLGKVKAVSLTGLATDTATTNPTDGTYRFDGLPEGAYNLTATVNGLVKSKNVVIRNGSDLPGVDFWCGGSTGDTTPPTIKTLAVSNVTSTGFDMTEWGYDTETGIDKISTRIGTTPGGNDFLGDTEVLTDTGVVHFTLNPAAGQTYYLTTTWTDGAGLTSSGTTTFSFGYPIQGHATLGDYSGAPVPLTVLLRTPGTLTTVQTITVTPDAFGNFTVAAAQTGTYDIAVKGSHWLRRVAHNVVVSSGGGNFSVSLVNGDINGDNSINLGDFAQLSTAFRSHPGDSNWNPNADLNGDGTVNLGDFAILSKNFRQVGDQ